jgi:hypothetical protein
MVSYCHLRESKHGALNAAQYSMPVDSWGLHVAP